ncbi:MAG: Vms1/Ankzf1 family peptidyl-tRNA hydrolase [Candidatus Binatia bacterium]
MLISRDEIARLGQLTSDHGIISAYIKIDPKFRHFRTHHLTQFKSAMKLAERRLQSSRWLDALRRESDNVLEFLDRWTPHGRGLVIFSSLPGEIWQQFELEVAVPSFVDIDTTTKTGILTRLVDEYPRLAVVVVQRDAATIYISEQRIVEQAEKLKSIVPGQHRQGGTAQARFERHIEFHASEHLKRIVDEVKALNESRPFRWLVVGGAERSVNELLAALPESIANKNIGTFPVDFKHETEDAILARARALAEQNERKTELQLVQQVLEATEAGDRGATGRVDTLQAVSEERVHTLVVSEGLSINGSACEQCGHFDAKEFDSCPRCGAESAKRDITDRVLEKAFLTGAHVETIYGEARERLTNEGSGLGALLRY